VGPRPKVLAYRCCRARTRRFRALNLEVFFTKLSGNIILIDFVFGNGPLFSLQSGLGYAVRSDGPHTQVEEEENSAFIYRNMYLRQRRGHSVYCSSYEYMLCSH
jgi:hypothetical protein